MKQNYHAIALDKRDIGEMDRLYTFYTLEEGLVRVPARSIRKANAKLSTQVEDFMFSHITIAKSFGRGTLAGAVTEECYENVRADYEAMTCIDTARTIFLKIMGENVADEKVFELWIQFLQEMNYLARGRNKRLIDYHWMTNAFLINLFSLQGYIFNPSKCCICHTAVRKIRNGFSAHKGGVVCRECLTGGDYCHVDVDTIKAMRVIHDNDFSLVRKVHIHNSVQKQMELIVNNITQWVTR